MPLGLLHVMPPCVLDPLSHCIVDLSHDLGGKSQDERSWRHLSFFQHSAPAPITDPRPIRTPLSKTAPIPIRQSSSTKQPCRMTRWPTVTRLPTMHGTPGSA